ncbi:MAG TPA: hypothetical protein VKY53_06005 [Marinobacter sp.]|nr:hypothetical protein [Marinobacter sp.]
MADLHIEDFYKDVAVILVQLYTVFPRRTNLFVEDIAGPDAPDEFGLHSKRHMACFGTLVWLQEEGWLRYVDTIRQEALDQAVLTHKAFVRLSAPVPRALAEKFGAGPAGIAPGLIIWADLLRAALKTGSSTRISLVVQAAFFTEPAAGLLH